MTQNKEKIFSEKKHIIKRKLFVIGMPIICACIVLIIVLTTIIIPNNRNERLAQKFKNVNVGDIITYGSYEQDNNTSNGKESIEWLVLAKENNKLFVISNKALDCQKYNVFNTDTTWENCSLRSWLNDTFLNSAFSKKEQSLILTTTVSADKNPKDDADPGNETNDKVFLLSITEAEKYFATDNLRQCKPTDYAVSNKGYRSNDTGNCWWWLRSPSWDQYNAADVSNYGDVEYHGINVDYDHNCVRPAMWISIENSTTKVSKENTDKNNDVKIGDIITFGTYEQDNNISNGKESIEWLVLAKENNKLFVISNKALDCQQYNYSYSDITWETSSLRSWLNDTFLYTAFSKKERSLIQTTTVFAEMNPEYDTDPGKETKDKVFLLSIKEAEKYFEADESRKCKSTAYAVANGAYCQSDSSCLWWLRSPGCFQYGAACVYSDGKINCPGYIVDYDGGCVRPAMWINIKNSINIVSKEINNKSDKVTGSSESFNESKESKVENTDKKNAADIGDIITFGTYEQNNNTSNGKEPIEWQVLAKENNKLFVISKKALDCQKYNDSFTDVTWETCSLRSWLNDTFLYTAFSEKERSLIQTTKVSADNNPIYDNNPGNETNDKVFLLSIAEVKEYFTTDGSRWCEPSDYAVFNGALKSENTNDCWWWLRSPGLFQAFAAGISASRLDYYGNGVDSNFYCVRPVMWIKLDF